MTAKNLILGASEAGVPVQRELIKVCVCVCVFVCACVCVCICVLLITHDALRAFPDVGCMRGRCLYSALPCVCVCVCVCVCACALQALAEALPHVRDSDGAAEQALVVALTTALQCVEGGAEAHQTAT